MSKPRLGRYFLLIYCFRHFVNRMDRRASVVCRVIRVPLACVLSTTIPASASSPRPLETYHLTRLSGIAEFSGKFCDNLRSRFSTSGWFPKPSRMLIRSNWNAFDIVPVVYCVDEPFFLRYSCLVHESAIGVPINQRGGGGLRRALYISLQGMSPLRLGIPGGGSLNKSSQKENP